MRKVHYLIILMTAVAGLVSSCTAEKEPVQKTDGANMGEGAMLEEKFLTPEEDRASGVITQEHASHQKYPALEEFLTEYYQIPEEYLSETRYYYTFANLSEAEIYEIFVAVIGEYTEQENGDPALVLTVQKDGSFEVVKAFDNIHTPVIISENVTNGWHDIIYQVYGKNVDDGYLTWKYQEDVGYQAEEVLDEEAPATGLRILSNNLIDDLDKGTYLTLAPSQDNAP